MATIMLSDGTTLSNLEVNGDNFISHTEITESIFLNKLSPVSIDTDNEHIIHPHMDLVQIIQVGHDWWFVLRDITDAELAQTKLRSDIDFLAMMTDVDLEDFE